MGVGIGTQSGHCRRERHSQLDHDHPLCLVELGPVAQRVVQAGVRGGRPRRLLAVEQARQRNVGKGPRDRQGLRGQRAGLVGTNTVRQNYSREAGLDYIVGHGGTITEAVSTMIWPGAAVVHVSIVNWVKGTEQGKKRLHMQEGNDVASGWRNEDLDRIPASLSFDFDVTSARTLKVNARVGSCFQGQTHGHEGFLIEAEEAKALIADDKTLKAVLKPFLTQDDLVGKIDSKPSRYVIDFSGLDCLEAAQYPVLFDRIKMVVLPQRKKAAMAEKKRNEESLTQDSRAKVNHHHENFLKRWWQLSYSRGDMMTCLSPLKRYIACGQLTKRPIFEFIDTKISPNAALTVFPFEDDYTFGILQSDIHWRWFVERCSTMKADPRYTSNTVFDSFPWPQSPSAGAVTKVAKSAVA